MGQKWNLLLTDLEGLEIPWVCNTRNKQKNQALVDRTNSVMKSTISRVKLTSIKPPRRHKNLPLEGFKDYYTSIEDKICVRIFLSRKKWIKSD